jgi:hypothetical protein
MKKNIVIGVLATMVMVLALLVWFQGQQIAGLKEQRQKMVEVDREMAKSARLARAAVPAPVEEAPAPVAEAKPVEPVTEAAPVASAATDGGATNNPMAGLAQMMKNPQMKQMVRAQQKFALDGMYGSLSKYLNLSTNNMDALKELLLDRQMALVDAGMSMMNGGSGADQKQAAEDAKTLKAEYDKKIADLLGPQDYPVFQEYEKSAADRMSVQMFKGSLPADSTLTDQQEESLVTAMAEERKALPPSSMVNNQNQSADPSKFTEESIAEAMKQMEQLQQRDAQRAATILTPAQLEQFTKFQEQMNSMAVAGMKMAQQMFGNKNAAPAPAAGTGP